MNQIKSVDTVILLCWLAGFCPARSQFNPWSLSLHCIKKKGHVLLRKKRLNILNHAGSSKTNHAYHRPLAIQSPTWKSTEIHICPVKAIGQAKWFYATNYSASPQAHPCLLWTLTQSPISHYEHCYILAAKTHTTQPSMLRETQFINLWSWC